MRHPFKVGFRNKHTANRRRSPINKHLSKIIVFTIRQRKIIRPKTARKNIICILHPFHVQNHNYVNNTPIVLHPSSIAEKDSKQNNRPQKNSTYPQVENITILLKNHFSLKNTITCLLKRQQYRSNRVGHFLRCVSMIIFFNQNHLCADEYAATVCAIKSTQLKQGQTTRCVFLNTRTYPSLFGKRFNFFVIRKATFRTQKRFHNKQYTPKSKDQPFESERTHFDTGFNNSNVAMHRQTFIFLLLYQNTTVQ